MWNAGGAPWDYYLEAAGAFTKSDCYFEYKWFYDPLLTMLQKAIEERFMFPSWWYMDCGQ